MGPISVAVVMVMVMMVVVMVVVAPPVRHHHDMRPTTPVMVMVVVMMMVISRELNIFIRRRSRSGFVDRLQHRRSVRDRFKQVGERIRFQNVGRCRTRHRGSLRRTECSECRHRSQQAGDFSSHGVLSNHAPGALPGRLERRLGTKVPWAPWA